MATKSRIVEPAFRLGCGRYIQEDNAISHLAEELQLLGCGHPFILAGRTAFARAGEAIKESLSSADIRYELYEYIGFCDPEHGARIAESEACMQADCIIGVGGGNVMDAAKLVAALRGLPVVNIPTSSATCAAYTPLSVMYNEKGQTIGTRHHKKEVDVILADMSILCRQPVRLLVAGIYDALAKVPETHQRLLGKSEDEIDIGLSSSYCMSRFMSERLLSGLSQVCLDVAAGKSTKLVYDTVYLTVALTGMISSLARGSNQTAIAHKIYETTRTLYPIEAHGALHGELVAIGLLTQLAYNGDELTAAHFCKTMQQCGMPTSLAQAGIPVEKDTAQIYHERIVNSSAMAGTTPEEQARLLEALGRIC